MRSEEAVQRLCRVLQGRVLAREVAAVTGSSVWAADRAVHLADRLATTLPATMAALAAGRVDLPRVQVLVEATSGLETAGARRVEKAMLDQQPPDAGPWSGAMAKVDLLHDAAVTGQPDDTTDDTTDAGADQRLPRPVVRRVARRELGVVLNADTLFCDGPAAGDPGEVRGTSIPVAADAATARVLAEQAQAGGASTCVLLADRDGMLVRLLRVGVPPQTGWTPATLTAATKAALARAPLPKHETDSYQPSAQISETVRARDAVCTFPGCGVAAGPSDLDHAVPYPRGPTSVTNLSPRSRRCHRYKTAGLWHVQPRTSSSGQVVAHGLTSHLGSRQVVEVRPLPGYAPGEAYAVRWLSWFPAMLAMSDDGRPRSLCDGSAGITGRPRRRPIRESGRRGLRGGRTPRPCEPGSTAG